jgi:hypothetical protein
MSTSQRVSRGFHPAFFVAVALLLMGKAEAQVPAFPNGNKLLELCEAKDEKDRAVCNVYIQGIVDEWRFVGVLRHRPACAPHAIGSQLTEAVINFLRVHPEVRDASAAELVTEAVTAAWHCK